MQMTIQTDGEPVLIGLAESSCKIMQKDSVGKRVSLQANPRDSHASNGPAERAVQTVRALARTYMSVLSGRVGKELGKNSVGWTSTQEPPQQDPFVCRWPWRPIVVGRLELETQSEHFFKHGCQKMTRRSLYGRQQKQRRSQDTCGGCRRRSQASKGQLKYGEAMRQTPCSANTA